nr:glycosyltransferase [Polymorphobacter sp.]
MTPPLHVIQTIDSIAERHGGPTRTIRDLCEALGRAGARVTRIAGNDPSGPDRLLRPDPALAETILVPRTTRLPFPRPDLTATISRLAGPHTIVHDNGLWTPFNLAIPTAARTAGIPWVISPHGMLAPWALAWRRHRKAVAWPLYQRRLLTGAVGLMATAPAEAAHIRAKVPGRPIAVIPNGVAVPAVLPDRRHRDAPQPRTLLFLSRLHPVKNLPGLLTAWGQLAANPNFAEWTLRIAGPDEANHRAEITALAAALPRVTIEGPIAEVEKAAAFATADLFILPSFTENFGVAAAEALAHGLPVIATTGAPWECLVANQCGWHVAPDPASLAAALTKAMSLTPQERRDMGTRGHALAARDFGWDAIARDTRAYYQWLLHGGTRPDFVPDFKNA